MGNCLGTDPPLAKIGTKTITTSAFHKIKTYGDALRAAGYPVQDEADIQVFRDEVVILTKGYYKFEFCDAVRYKGNTISIKKLYGKQNGSKTSQKK
jgi:hypothetical protein